MSEVWRELVDFPGYHVSDLGRIGSSKRSKVAGRGVILNTFFAPNGFESINLRRDGKYVSCEVHRLVALTFVPNPQDYTIVKHVDEDKTNNRASNLYWSLRTGPGGVDGSAIVIVETGEEYPSVRAYANQHGCSTSSIYKVLQGVRKTYHGQTFKWKEAT